MKRRGKISCLMFWAFLCLGVVSFNSCKDEATAGIAAYDPNKPVEITDFSPKEGSMKTRLFINGRNFGNDPSKIKVSIGGVDAKVIGASGDYIYCMVPFRSGEGTVKVTIGEQEIVAAEKFIYHPETRVTTLAGYVDEDGKSEVKDGPFDDCGFGGPSCLRVDPNDYTKLYLWDNGIRLLDLATDSVSTLVHRGEGNWSDVRAFYWSSSGDTIFVANKQDSDQGLAVSFMTRANKFRRPEVLIQAKGNNSAACHPINGELYYNNRSNGMHYKYDFNTKEKTHIFTIPYGDCLCFINFHPSGNYAYLVVGSNRIIMKAMYNWEKRQLEVPNVFAGSPNQWDYVDGQGTNARFKDAYGGCFVYNEEYAAQGKEDCYDFYLCDRMAACVRKVTPDAVVTTYAGRGRAGDDSSQDEFDGEGYVDGHITEEARFRRPNHVTYSEYTKTFYISDENNKRIRAIAVDE